MKTNKKQNLWNHSKEYRMALSPGLALRNSAQPHIEVVLHVFIRNRANPENYPKFLPGKKHFSLVARKVGFLSQKCNGVADNRIVWQHILVVFMHVSCRVWIVNFVCSQPDPRHGKSKWHLSLLELFCTAEPPPPHWGCALSGLHRLRAGLAAPRGVPSPVRVVFTSTCGEFLWFFGMTLPLHSDLKDPTLEQCGREEAATKRDWKEKRADSTFRIPFSLWWSYEQHQWSLSQEQELVPSFPGDSIGSHGPTAPPASGKDLPPGTSKVCMAFSASLSNPLVWGKHCSPIPVLAQQSEFVFPSWSGEHPTAWAQRNTSYISVFHWNSIIFLMAWGQLKFSSCAAEVFSTKAGVLTMVAWHSSSSARSTRLSRCSGSRGSAPRSV